MSASSTARITHGAIWAGKLSTWRNAGAKPEAVIWPRMSNAADSAMANTLAVHAISAHPTNWKVVIPRPMGLCS